MRRQAPCCRASGVRLAYEPVRIVWVALGASDDLAGANDLAEDDDLVEDGAGTDAGLDFALRRYHRDPSVAPRRDGGERHSIRRADCNSDWKRRSGSVA